ncbi:MAG: hypothetical protein AB7I13_00265 [Vicinamibacterales bacterium]
MSVHILRLLARCPTCGTAPRLRTFPSSQELLEGKDPTRVVMTYQCHVRTCDTVYEIRVRDFTEAA